MFKNSIMQHNVARSLVRNSVWHCDWDSPLFKLSVKLDRIALEGHSKEDARQIGHEIPAI